MKYIPLVLLILFSGPMVVIGLLLVASSLGILDWMKGAYEKIRA